MIASVIDPIGLQSWGACHFLSGVFSPLLSHRWTGGLPPGCLPPHDPAHLSSSINTQRLCHQPRAHGRGAAALLLPPIVILQCPPSQRDDPARPLVPGRAVPLPVPDQPQLLSRGGRSLFSELPRRSQVSLSLPGGGSASGSSPLN